MILWYSHWKFLLFTPKISVFSSTRIWSTEINPTQVFSAPQKWHWWARWSLSNVDLPRANRSHQEGLVLSPHWWSGPEMVGVGSLPTQKGVPGIPVLTTKWKKTLQLRMSVDKISSNRVFKQDCQNGGCQMVTCSTAVANQLSQVSSIPSTTTASMLVT